jgi:hypothetical protein
MEEWTEKYSELHKRKYWANKTTGKTSWTNPNPNPNPDTEVAAASPQVDRVNAVTNDWVEKYSEQHKRKYWANKVTGKTSWTNPNLTSESSETAPQPAGATSSDSEWIEKYSEQHKRKYWTNKTTGKTSWTNPSPSSASTVPTAATGVTGASSEAKESEEWVEKFSEQHKRKYWANKTTGKTSWTNPNPNPGTSTAVAGSGGEAEWAERYSEQHKRKYWTNKTTGKTSWTNPLPLSSSPMAPVAGTGAGAGAGAGEWTEKFSAKHQRKYWVGPQGATTWTDPQKSAAAAGPASSSSSSVVPTAEAGASSSVSERCQKLETDLEALQRRQSELQERLDGATRERDECQAKIQTMALAQEGTSEQWAQERTELSSRLNEAQLQCRELQAECLRLSTERDIYLKLHHEDEKRRDKYDEERVKLLTHGTPKEETFAPPSASSAEVPAGAGLMDIISLQHSHEQYVRKLHAESEIKILEERARGSKEMSKLQQELQEAGEKSQQSKSRSERLERALADMREKYTELETKYCQKCDEADRMGEENQRIARDRTELQRAIELKSQELLRYLQQGSEAESTSALMMASLTNNLLREVQSLIVSTPSYGYRAGDFPDEAPPPERYLDVVYDDLEPPPDDDLPSDDPDDLDDDDEPDSPPPMDL